MGLDTISTRVGTSLGEPVSVKLLAGQATWIAVVPLQAALATRLDHLAEEAGLDSDLGGSSNDAISAFLEAWPDAEDFDWSERVDSTIRDRFAVIADQAAVFVFESSGNHTTGLGISSSSTRSVLQSRNLVPASKSVAAAQAEERLWGEGSEAWSAFTPRSGKTPACKPTRSIPSSY